MLSRRRFLAVSGASIVALSGCSQSDDPGDGGSGGDGSSGDGSDGGDGSSGDGGDGAATQSSEPVRIGSLHPLAPPTTELAESERNGIQLAEQKINSEGGINGRDVEVLTRNSEANPEVGFQAAQELVNGENVDMLFGDIISSTSLAIGDWISGPNIPYFTPASADGLTGENCAKQMFVLNESERMQSAALAPWMVENSGTNGYIHTWDFAWGYSLESNYRARLEEMDADVTVIDFTTSPLTETDFSGAISEIISADPDWVFLGFAAAGLSTFLRQAQQFGLKNEMDVYGAEATMSARRAAPEAIAGTTHIVDYDPESDNDANAEFTSMYADEYDDQPSQWSMRAWEAVHLYKAAAESAGTTESEPVISELENIEIQSLMGTLSLRECDHRQTRDVRIGEVSGMSEYDVPGFDILQTTPADEAMPPCSEIPCSF